jgi:hypothetical protein
MRAVVEKLAATAATADDKRLNRPTTARDLEGPVTVKSMDFVVPAKRD